ncbi:unnamed protein product [Caenorhabditis angaria]|uniref:C2H2-type domain-containing protein n=1 Tax=Caenorhabditis angaria TaxID=860376 RepID=A0A9P1IS24_9PELO|nr:unnamed protein product [Caenorhabditis angaria]
MCKNHRDYVDSIVSESNADDGDKYDEDMESSSEHDLYNNDPDFVPDSDSKTTGGTCMNDIRRFFYKFAHAAGFTRITSRKPFKELSYGTQLKKVSMTKKLINAVIEEISPEHPEILKNWALSQDTEEIWGDHQDSHLSSLLENIAFRYRIGGNRAERISILSLVAKTFPLTQIQKYIPGLSRFVYDEARKQTDYEPQSLKRKRERFNPSALHTFINFITSSIVMVPNTFGMRKIKFSDGKVDYIPDILRKQTSSEIVRMYKEYLKDTDQENKLLSDSTLYNILSICSASKLRAHQCVDYFLADLFEAQVDIKNILEKLRSKNLISGDFFEDSSSKLNEFLLYLRTDYALHIKESSRISDHCISHSLSEDKEQRLAKRCSHSHDLACKRCKSGTNLLENLKETLSSIVSDAKTVADENDSSYNLQRHSEAVDMYRGIIESIEKILAYKKHVMRARVTENEKAFRLANLQEGEAVLLMDYAQKLLPLKHIERQTDYFGKTGMSWHVAHVTANVSSELKVHHFIHILKAKQDSKSTVSIIEHVLSSLKKQGIKKVFLRSDNAGNYHSTSTIGSLPQISQRTGVEVMEYSFSESQDGKSSCDRLAAVAKKKIHTAVDSGYDVTTEEELFSVLSEKSQITATSVFIMSLKQSANCEDKQNQKFEKISKLFHFTFDKNRIIGNGYRGIGSGIIMNKNDVIVMNPVWIIEKESEDTSEYWYIPKIKTTEMREKKQPTPQSDDLDIQEPEGNIELFACPQSGCMKKYTSYPHLERHLIGGKHKFHPERISLLDQALNMYKENIASFFARLSSQKQKDSMKKSQKNKYKRQSDMLGQCEDTEDLNEWFESDYELDYKYETLYEDFLDNVRKLISRNHGELFFMEDKLIDYSELPTKHN